MKKLNLLLIIGLMFIVMSMSVNGDNIALDGTAVCSEVRGDEGNINDGNSSTSYDTGVGMGGVPTQWCRIDFTEDRTVTQINMTGYTTSAETYNLGLFCTPDGESEITLVDYKSVSFNTNNEMWNDTTQTCRNFTFRTNGGTNNVAFGIAEFIIEEEDIDTTPPTNSTWNVTSQNLPAGENSSIWNAGGQYVINVTNNTGSITVVTNEASNGSCAIGKNWNYSTMVAYEPNYKFATTDVTEHAYLIYDDIPIGNSCLYCSFIDASGNEFANSSSGCLNLTRTIPITGYVFDDLTNVIEGAIVYITNLFTNVTEKVTTNVSGMYESSQGYEKGIHLISGYDPSNYSLQPDAQLVNVTE